MKHNTVVKIFAGLVDENTVTDIVREMSECRRQVTNIVVSKTITGGVVTKITVKQPGGFFTRGKPLYLLEFDIANSVLYLYVFQECFYTVKQMFQNILWYNDKVLHQLGTVPGFDRIDPAMDVTPPSKLALDIGTGEYRLVREPDNKSQ